MIGSHDSFTYCKSTSWWYNHAKKYWKTQRRSIEEQYKWGVRFFDIRVYRDGNIWRTCHGVVNLTKCFNSLKEICEYMKTACPTAIYRIVLEKGSERAFKSQALNTISAFKAQKLNLSVDKVNTPIGNIEKVNPNLCDLYPNLWRVDIKANGDYLGSVCNNNQKLYDRGYKFALVAPWTSPAHELHGQVKTGNIFKIDLRKEAMKINREIFDKHVLTDLLESKEYLYFIDYSTNEY